jgi:hypothetical protein
MGAEDYMYAATGVSESIFTARSFIKSIGAGRLTSTDLPPELRSLHSNLRKPWIGAGFLEIEHPGLFGRYFLDICGQHVRNYGKRDG